ncbi:serine hydrolase domain-containing protein [Stenotrophomonas sp.]|uniref:serine hydrolase domain-containing protein n=1 Tax=Stenotrophomonas sp. TaxID=69392 RepID=UPI00289A8F16|nr:serine hydrolase domain-containing protein [Stenotrophomonas sp.]
MKHRIRHPGGGTPLRVAAMIFALLALPAAASDLHDAAIDAALDAGLRPGVLEPGDSLPRWSLQQRMSEHHVPGVAIAVLRDGKLVHAAGYGVRAAGSDAPVNADTLFSVGSVSKVVTAATTLRLVADGRLDLDQNIQHYLTDWRVPSTAATPHPLITLRMLLSHTSGLGVHGFADYLPGEALPTLLQTLDGVPPAKNQPIRLIHAPGERGDYSGGGVMVEQHVLESVSGQRLDTLARAQVFTPVGMSRSRFDGPPEDTDNIAKAHDGKGAVTALPRGWQSFPEAGASGLWTSAADVGRFVAALTNSYQGKDTFLPRPLATDMMTPVSPSWHGLGPRLDGDGVQRIFHHGGSNDSYRAWIEGYLETGDGFVILTNGENGAALAAEIRNALSDVIGRGVNPVVRSIALDPQSAVVASIAGRYQRSDAVPMALQGALADVFDIPGVEVTVGDKGVGMGVAGTRRSGRLLPVSPNRFVSPDVEGLQVEFQRDAWGEVSGLVVMLGDARAYYVR